MNIEEYIKQDKNTMARIEWYGEEYAALHENIVRLSHAVARGYMAATGSQASQNDVIHVLMPMIEEVVIEEMRI